MSIELDGEYHHNSEREKSAESLQFALKVLQRFNEAINQLEWNHRIDAIKNLSEAINEVLKEEISLLENPEFNSSNQRSDFLIAQARKTLHYDSDKRNSLDSKQ